VNFSARLVFPHLLACGFNMWCPFALTEYKNPSAIALQSTQPF